MSFAAWCTSSVTVCSQVGKDAWGKPIWGPQRTLPARVEMKRRMLHRPTGDEALAVARVWTMAPVLVTDRVWLPSADTTTLEGSQLPIDVSAASDKTGARTIYTTDI